MYEHFSDVFIELANKHAPVKKKERILTKPVPFMNKMLMQNIYKKKMLFNKFQNNKTKRNWENFRKQRNLVVSLKRNSINKYFIDRCMGRCKSENFWPSINPFLTDKGIK